MDWFNMKIPKIKKWQIIEIDWLDSCHLAGWTRDEFDWDLKDLEHKTVGYFIKETKYSIAVIQSRKAEVKEKGTSVDALMEIPKVAVTKIRVF
jgi:hypothetical protein